MTRNAPSHGIAPRLRAGATEPAARLSVYFFLQAAVTLLVARLVGRLARRYGQPQVAGEMIAGVTLGPSRPGLPPPDLQQALFPKQTLDTPYVLAQFGVGPYMFLVGIGFRGDHFLARFEGAIVLALFCLRAFAMDAIGIHAVFGGVLLGACMPKGALMNAHGLIEPSLINIGLQAGVIEPGLFSILVLMAIVTTRMATPLSDWIVRRHAPTPAPEPAEA